MSEQIFYYSNKYSGKNRPISKVNFELVFKDWVEYNGGNESFLKQVGKLHPVQLEYMPSTFLEYFQYKYEATLPDENDEYYQDFVYDFELYRTYIRRIEKEHNERPTSPQNIIFIAIIVFAIIGVIKSCN